MEPATTLRVLVVDDDDAVRMVLRMVFESDRWKVLAARDADEALAVSALADDIDLLVADVHLAGTQGPALHRLLMQSHPDLRVLFVSAEPRESLIRRGLLDASSAFLEKPFSPLDLLSHARAAAGIEA